MGSLNKFRSKNVLNNSHNKLHGHLNDYLIAVPHTYNYLSGPSAVNFNHTLKHEDQGGFSMPRKEGDLCEALENLPGLCG